MELSTLKAGVADLTIDYMGSEIDVSYYPSYVTHDKLIEFTNIESLPVDEQLTVMYEALGDLIASWSITVDGKMAPVKETLKELGFSFVGGLFTTIVGDINVQDAEGKSKTSEGTS